MSIEFNMASLTTPRMPECNSLEFEASIFTPDRRRFRQH
jgi:hypothetical protein